MIDARLLREIDELLRDIRSFGEHIRETLGAETEREFLKRVAEGCGDAETDLKGSFSVAVDTKALHTRN